MEILTIKTLKVYLYDKSSYRKRQILIGDAIAMGCNAMEAFQNGDVRLKFKITKKKKGYETLFQRTDVLCSRHYAITLKMITVDNRSGKEEKFTGRNKNCIITDYYVGVNGEECVEVIMQPSLNEESALELFAK